MNSNKLNTKSVVTDKELTGYDKKIIAYPKMNLVGSSDADSKIKRNPGIEFNIDRISNITVNRSAVERRCAGYAVRRSIKKQQQAAWLLKAISLIDLTTLSGDDTESRVKRLCGKSKRPLSAQLIKSLDIESLNLSVAAVCVYHDMLKTAHQALKDSKINWRQCQPAFPPDFRRSL